MSIQIEEGKTLGMWFVKLPKDHEYDNKHQGGDWLCHLGYEEKDGKRILVGKYRFRYYTKNDTGDPFKDDDIKTWYTVKPEGKTEAYTIASFRYIATKMALSTGNELYENLVGDDFKAFMKRFMAAPFVFQKNGF